MSFNFQKSSLNFRVIFLFLILLIFSIYSGSVLADENNNSVICTTQWTCSQWSQCINGIETRSCIYPKDSCDPVSPRPQVSQACNMTNTERNPNLGGNSTASNTTATGRRGITGFAVAAGNAAGSPVGIVIILAILGVGGFFATKKYNTKKSAKNSKAEKKKE